MAFPPVTLSLGKFTLALACPTPLDVTPDTLVKKDGGDSDASNRYHMVYYPSDRAILDASL